MKRILDFIKSLSNGFPLDKLTHFGFGGLICGFFTLIALCSQCLPIVRTNILPFVGCWAFGAVVTTLLAMVKEAFDTRTSGWSYEDIIASSLGTLPILLATVMGYFLYVSAISNALTNSILSCN